MEFAKKIQDDLRRSTGTVSGLDNMKVTFEGIDRVATTRGGPRADAQNLKIPPINIELFSHGNHHPESMTQDKADQTITVATPPPQALEREIFS